jgi:hypothetical protein
MRRLSEKIAHFAGLLWLTLLSKSGFIRLSDHQALHDCGTDGGAASPRGAAENRLTNHMMGRPRQYDPAVGCRGPSGARNSIHTGAVRSLAFSHDSNVLRQEAMT